MSDPNQNDDRQADKDFCEKESNQAYDTILKNQEEYDRQLLTLSTGLLAVLVAFLKDVVHLDSATFRPLIYIGLSSLGLTIILVIISFQFSNHAFEKIREYYKKRYASGIDQDFPDVWSDRVKYLNWSAGFAFIAGVSLTIAFITVNLAHQNRLGARNELRELTGGRSGQDADKREPGKRSDDKGADQARTDGEQCVYH